METQIFQFVGATVTNATDAFIGPATSQLMTALQALALAGVSLYIYLMGAAILFGTVQSPIGKFVIQSLKLVFITAIALTADTYSAVVVSTFEGLEAGLAEAMNVGEVSSTSIYQVLDQTLGKGVELMNTCFRQADEAGWNFGSIIGWILAGIAVAVGVTAVAVLGGAAVIVAKFALTIMFALGPFFILLLCFPVTARFFETWFSQVMNYTLLVVIIAIIMAFAMAAIGAFLQSADLSGAGEVNALMVAVEISALCFVLVFIIYQAYGMSAALAGGLSMAALTAAHMAVPGRMAKQAINPTSTRRDLESNMMVTRSRADHLIAGNSMINPAYSQRALGQIGKNYSRWQGGSVRKQG